MSQLSVARGLLAAHAAGGFALVPRVRKREAEERLWGQSWSSLTGKGATAGLRSACEQGCGPELGSRAETGGASQAGSESAGIRAGPEEGLGQPRDAPNSCPAANPALLFLRSLREQTFSQTERARRSQGPEHEWGAR